MKRLTLDELKERIAGEPKMIEVKLQGAEAPIKYDETKSKAIPREWNAKPENKKSFWEKHETAIFDGIGKGLLYFTIACGIVTAGMQLYMACN